MNYSRIVLAGVAAWIVNMVYGFVVYGNLMAGQFASSSAVYRGVADVKMLPLSAGVLIYCLALAVIYSKGYGGRNGVAEGVRFGALVGIVMVGLAISNYAVLNIASGGAAAAAVAGFVEFVLVGTVIGAVCKPAVRPRVRTAVV